MPLYIISLAILISSVYAQRSPEGMGYPKGYPADTVLERNGYSLGFSKEHKQARWVSYNLLGRELGGSVVIVEKLREDPELKGLTASKDDYKGSDYSIGFLAPEEDFKWSAQTKFEVYYMSNTTPQKPYFKKMLWRNLEAQVRKWAKEYASVYIFTGPVLFPGMQGIGKGKVSAPKQFYKIVARKNDNRVKAVGFLMDNEPSSTPLKKFVVPIDSIETLTGLDFFPEMDPLAQRHLESQVIVEDWKF